MKTPAAVQVTMDGSDCFCPEQFFPLRVAALRPLAVDVAGKDALCDRWNVAAQIVQFYVQHTLVTEHVHVFGYAQLKHRPVLFN